MTTVNVISGFQRYNYDDDDEDYFLISIFWNQ